MCVNTERMNKMDVIEKIYEDKIVIKQKIHFGQQLLFRFDNSYGLSVIEELEGAGPKYNIAIVKFGVADNDYKIDYSTGITNSDVKSDNDEVLIHLISLVEKL